MKKYLLIIVLILINTAFAQERENEIFKPHHSLGFVVGHTNVSQGVENGDRKWLSLPSFALDYNYVFSPKWSIGLHNDLIIESYKVETSEDEVLERSSPFATAIVGGFKPGKHFTFQAGLGGEFAKEENFFLTRLGVEYGLEIRNGWEFIANVIYDIKWNAYDSYAVGMGISKSFGN
jgi:hypothetical protein